ncbi:MAG: hypothetical protein ACTSVV_09135 [Promethearchaeota archaeon]
MTKSQIAKDNFKKYGQLVKKIVRDNKFDDSDLNKVQEYLISMDLFGHKANKFNELREIYSRLDDSHSDKERSKNDIIIYIEGLKKYFKGQDFKYLDSTTTIE